MTTRERAQFLLADIDGTSDSPHGEALDLAPVEDLVTDLLAKADERDKQLAAAMRAELCGIARYDENLHQLARKLGITL